MHRSKQIYRELLAALTCLVTCQMAPATGPYLSAGPYFAQPDSSRLAEHDFGLQVSTGYQFNPEWSLELVSDMSRFRSDPQTTLFDQQGLSLQGAYSFAPDLELKPIFIGGVGWLHTKANGIKEDNPTARAGLGFIWENTSLPFAIRADAVARREFQSNAVPGIKNYDDFIYSASLVYHLNQKTNDRNSASASPSTRSSTDTGREQTHAFNSAHRTEPVRAPEKVITSKPQFSPNAKDWDGDGLENTLDKCQETPAGFKIDADGCHLTLTK